MSGRSPDQMAIVIASRVTVLQLHILSRFSGLPDLTAQRKTLRDFLDAIRDDIIVLVRTKGYTLADVRDTLKNAGYEVGEKALRDIIREAESKKPSRRSSSKTAPKKTDSGRKDGIDINNN